MSTDGTAVAFINVSKHYRLYQDSRHRLAPLVRSLLGSNIYTMKVANNQLSFTIERGESVAILGRNGAGKSTLLKMITGVVFPTSGTVEVNGRVSAILELTAGFDATFTGRENIHIKGMLLGLDKEEIARIENPIVEFADVGEYIDQPVRTYSSGMKARLGFAINSHIDPDILVIDEALSVGDKRFQQKCKERIAEIRQREHTTVILVTHATDAARSFCERGLVLETGNLVYDGPIDEAIEFYGRGPR